MHYWSGMVNICSPVQHFLVNRMCLEHNNRCQAILYPETSHFGRPNIGEKWHFLGFTPSLHHFFWGKTNSNNRLSQKWSYLQEIVGNGQNKVQKGYFCQINHFEKAKFRTFFSFLLHIWALLSSKQHVLTPIMSKNHQNFHFLSLFTADPLRHHIWVNLR